MNIRFNGLSSTPLANAVPPAPQSAKPWELGHGTGCRLLYGSEVS